MDISQPWVLSTERTIACGAEIRSAENALGIGESLQALPAKLLNRRKGLVVWKKTI